MRSVPRNSVSMKGPLPHAFCPSPPNVKELPYFSMTLAGTIAHVGLDISRKAGTNGSLSLKENVYGSGVCNAARSAFASGELVPEILSGKRLSGAVIAVPRRIQLSFTSVEVSSSPAAGLSALRLDLDARAQAEDELGLVRARASRRDVAKLLKIGPSSNGFQLYRKLYSRSDNVECRSGRYVDQCPGR